MNRTSPGRRKPRIVAGLLLATFIWGVAWMICRTNEPGPSVSAIASPLRPGKLSVVLLRHAKWISLVGYVGMLAGLVGLALQRALLSASPWIILVQGATLLLAIWARLTFGRRSYHVAANPTEGGLVTWGPYRYIRHPIYTAIGVFVLAAIAAHWSWQAGVWGGLIVGSLLLRVCCEESLLTAKYAEYGPYAARTWRMIPYVY